MAEKREDWTVSLPVHGWFVVEVTAHGTPITANQARRAAEKWHAEFDAYDATEIRCSEIEQQLTVAPSRKERIADLIVRCHKLTQRDDVDSDRDIALNERMDRLVEAYEQA